MLKIMLAQFVRAKSGTARYGSLAPGTASLAPMMVHLAPPGMYGTGDGKPGTGVGEPEPGTHDQGAPGTADGRAWDGMSTGNNMDCESGTGDGKSGTRDCAVQFTCIHARLLNKFTLV